MFNAYTKEAYLSFEGPMYAENSRDAFSISASRTKFRKWLTNDLDISWGHTFKSYEVLPSGRVRVHFDNGNTAEGDVLVGADGSQSRGMQLTSAYPQCAGPLTVQFLVRTQLFAGNPEGAALHRLPHACVAGLVTMTKERYQKHMTYGPSLYTTDGAGLRVFVGLRSFSEDLSTALFVWLLFWVDEELSKQEGLHASLNASPEAQLKYAREATKDLHPDFQEIFADTKPEDMLGSLVLQDRIPIPCPDGPVTLLGDAMHVMSPCETSCIPSNFNWT